MISQFLALTTIAQNFEIPEWSDSTDDFYDYMQSFLEELLDFLVWDLAGGVWDTLINTLGADILGVNAALIVLIIGTGLTARYFIFGSFFG
jgi:hypothetical protein